MNRISFLTRRYFYIPLIMASLFSGCQENEGELGEAAKASFKVTPVTGKTNTYLLESTSENAFRYQWDIGAGQGLRAGKAIDTAYFLKKGTYEVKLYAHGSGGYDVATQQVTVANDDLSPILNNEIFKKLTAHPWKLDPNSTAPIIVGTEGNPAQYFQGGALADCQKDDVYTFAFVNNDFKASYNANGATFNAGNISPNYSCSTDRSYNNVSFTFSTTVAGAGLATITLPENPPSKFIGVTDVSSNNYRIISISDTEMVLRSGKANETVHQFRFIAQ
ncbi:hypothetical protein [Pedobacter sp. SYSU D00535]|uniref:hypothetical protein n=1 Tax=Pedobacter sp. SYSU D00535 TaxID=2810308 RepID=UPI001A965BC3|nr:hypothetical protein [Pedobacter sp. SYSU D00535]